VEKNPVGKGRYRKEGGGPELNFSNIFRKGGPWEKYGGDGRPQVSRFKKFVVSCACLCLAFFNVFFLGFLGVGFY